MTNLFIIIFMVVALVGFIALARNGWSFKAAWEAVAALALGLIGAAAAFFNSGGSPS